MKRLVEMLSSWAEGRRDAARAGDAWSQASTLDELGELTAAWLEGTLPGHPCYFGSGPDEETAGLVPVLAAVNRAGFVTEVSQPGVDEVVDGVRWQQRAAVSGFVTDGATVRALAKAAVRSGLWIVAQWPASGPDPGLEVLTAGDGPDPDGLVVVTTRDGQPCTGFGRRRSTRAIRSDWSNWCNRDAVNSLIRAHQVTLVDPGWGRDTKLWPAIAATLTGDSAGITRKDGPRC